jgi:hypothetical protein
MMEREYKPNGWLGMILGCVSRVFLSACLAVS